MISTTLNCDVMDREYLDRIMALLKAIIIRDKPKEICIQIDTVKQIVILPVAYSRDIDNIKTLEEGYYKFEPFKKRDHEILKNEEDRQGNSKDNS